MFLHFVILRGSDRFHCFNAILICFSQLTLLIFHSRKLKITTISCIRIQLDTFQKILFSIIIVFKCQIRKSQ